MKMNHEKQISLKKAINILPTLLLILILAYLSLTVEGFLTKRNILNVFNQSSAIGLMAIGVTFVFLVAGMELSIAANMALSATIGAIIMREGGDPLVAGIAMLLIATAIGIFNGLAVSFLNMNPFVVTLSTMYVASGATLWITEAQSVIGVSDKFISVVNTKVGPIQLSIIVLFLFTILMTVLVKTTSYGRQVYAVGTNLVASRISGINDKLIKTSCFAISGFFAGTAAIINTARLASASANMGQSTVILDVVSSVLVGGVSAYGGKGSPLNALFGALLITLITNSMNMAGVSYYVTLITKGCVIIVYIAFDYFIKRRASNEG